ncbi:response regulator [Leptolyngbya sp. AN02str]|uniref:response regulator n=1 Tax=Leptolyngbya sp. AN02str TaxID=3423363 RepID=UPI003D314AC3
MSKRILLIEDEERIRAVVQACLEDLGKWHVILAASGDDGLKLADQHFLDAILLDISMPDLDGFEICDRLKANPATQSIPIVLLTAKTLPSDRARFAKMEIAGIISKPFNPLSLCQLLSDILGWEL